MKYTQLQIEEPKVSVIMGVCRKQRSQNLANAVLSVLHQSYKNIELVIFNDGSSEPVKAQLHELADEHPKIKLIESQVNHGLGYALNRCFERSLGEYIARMDDDDESASDRISRQVEWLEEHKDVDWLGTNAVVFDDEGEWGVTKRPEQPVRKDFISFSPYIHPTVMFRKRVLSDNSYSETNVTRRCEDFDLFLRLTAKGYRGYNLQEQLLKYRVDRNDMHSRSMRERINESRVRYEGYKKLNYNPMKAGIFSLRPIVAGVIPARIIRAIKRKSENI